MSRPAETASGWVRYEVGDAPAKPEHRGHRRAQQHKSFAAISRFSSAKASRAMKMDMVKPIPGEQADQDDPSPGHAGRQPAPTELHHEPCEGDDAERLPRDEGDADADHDQLRAAAGAEVNPTKGDASVCERLLGLANLRNTGEGAPHVTHEHRDPGIRKASARTWMVTVLPVPLPVMRPW
jgi:hypothetical protein